MTLSSRHRIRNSSPGGLRPSTLLLGHESSPQYWLSHVNGEETFFVSFKPPRTGTEPRTLAWKATNHYPRAPAQKCSIYHRHSGHVDINKLWGCFSNTPIMSTVTVYHTKRDIEGTTRGGGGGVVDTHFPFIGYRSVFSYFITHVKWWPNSVQTFPPKKRKTFV